MVGPGSTPVRCRENGSGNRLIAQSVGYRPRNKWSSKDNRFRRALRKTVFRSLLSSSLPRQQWRRSSPPPLESDDPVDAVATHIRVVGQETAAKSPKFWFIVQVSQASVVTRRPHSPTATHMVLDGQAIASPYPPPMMGPGPVSPRCSMSRPSRSSRQHHRSRWRRVARCRGRTSDASKHRTRVTRDHRGKLSVSPFRPRVGRDERRRNDARTQHIAGGGARTS